MGIGIRLLLRHVLQERPPDISGILQDLSDFIQLRLRPAQ